MFLFFVYFYYFVGFRSMFLNFGFRIEMVNEAVNPISKC